MKHGNLMNQKKFYNILKYLNNENILDEFANK